MIKSILRRALSWKARVFLRKVLYFGLKYRCSVCGSRVRKLRPAGHDFPVLEDLEVVGGKYRVEDSCPVCLSNSRTRLVHRYLSEEMGIEALDLRLLHIAPEHGIYLSLHGLGGIQYHPADLSQKRYARSFPVEHMNITEIDYGANSFDAIICNHVLEHIEDDGQAMAELFRVLAPGGWAILQVPISRKLRETLEDRTIIDPAERERRFGQKDHVRIYAMDYTERLSAAGFAVEVFDPADRWGRDTVEALRLDPKERIFIGRKNQNSHPGV